MNVVGRVIAYITLVVIIIVLGFLVWALLRGLAGLDPRLLAAFITLFGTVAISVISVVMTRRWEQRLAVEQERRNRKIPSYEEFLEFLFQLLKSSKDKEQSISQEDMEKSLTKFTQKLVLWGDDEVIKEFLNWRRAAVRGGAGAEMVFTFERILYAIRSDLGHSNKGLGRGDLLSLFVNDMDEVLRDANQKA